jgi:Flp pilus assembly protein TadD
MGRLADARAHFERALQIDPNQPIARENLDALEKRAKPQ